MSVDPRPCLIHVGLPRCGSTALQFNTFVRLPDTVYFGKPLPEFSLPMRRLFLALSNFERWEWQRERPAIERDLLRPLLARPGARLVLSEEELGLGRFDARVDRWELARRLHAWFPQAEVLMVVREQQSLLASIYAHLTTLERVGELAGRSYVEWLGDQLARPWRLLHALRLADAIGPWVEHFGAARVHLRLHEDHRTQPAAFLASLAPLLGCEPERLLALSLARARNQRPPDIDTTLPADLRVALTELYGPGNLALARALPLDFARHGYLPDSQPTLQHEVTT